MLKRNEQGTITMPLDEYEFLKGLIKQAIKEHERDKERNKG